jgi:hypothetical protein
MALWRKYRKTAPVSNNAATSKPPEKPARAANDIKQTRF